MDIATLIGLLVGALVIVGSVVIAGASLGAFVDYPSVVCVLIGSVAAVLVCVPLRNFLGLGKVSMKALFNKQENIPELIELLVSLAETARRDGLLALEGKLADVKNPFIVLGIQMAVDGTRPEVIEEVMRTELDAVSVRHRDGKYVIDQLGRFAPAFGMIGTLIGLVIMLGNMSDPNAIGPGMAVALLTTLYGAVISNLVYIPIAEKLGFLHRQEVLVMDIIIRGIMGIQSGDNPRVIQQKLNTFLPPKLRAGANQAA
jgi:chemotaxis protein MotA